MAIKMIFDPSNNIQSPTMVLTYKSGKSIGAILPHNIHYIESLNSYNEFSFDVYKIVDGVECKHWSKIKDFKIIYCVEWDAYFEICVDIDESNDTVKHIQGRALSEAEVSQIKVYDLEINTELDISREDYRPTIIYSEDPDISLVHKLLEKTPNFRIGHIDKSIAKLQRTFSFNDKTIYDSFNAVSEEVNCLVEYVAKKGDNGKIDRVINIYDLMSNCEECGHREIDGDICPEYEGNKSGHPDGGRKINPGFGEDTTIFVSTKNLADNISYSSNSDSVKNCFKLKAGDDLMTATVRNCSPSRNGYMWHFTEDTKADMSDELRVILSEYQATYDRYNTGFNEDDVDYGDDWHDLVYYYNGICVKYQKEGSDSYKDHRIPTIFNNYQEIMNAYYNTIDLELYLNSVMMPVTNINNITASEQIKKLDNTYNISLQSISNLSSYSAKNAIEAFLNTIIDPRFKIRLEETSFNDAIKKWVGKITIELFTNNDEEVVDNPNFATSNNITFIFNDDAEGFTKQKIEKALAKERQNTPDIIALFDIGDNGEYKDISKFKDKITEYGLNPLIRLRDAGQACLNLMIEMGITNSSNKTSNWIKNWESENQNKSLYNDLYLPYYERVTALSNEIFQRQKDINIVAGKYDSNGNLITDGMMTYLLKIIMSIQSKLDLEGYITSLGGDSAEYLLQELVSFRREDTYRNENFISDGLDNSQLFLKALEFVKEAEKDIKLAAVPVHTITSTLKNLLAMKEFKALVQHFKVGNWIRAEIDGVIFRLRLIKYEVDFNNTNNINVEFSDVQLAKDSTAGIKSILDQATTIASNYSNIQVMAKQNKKSGDYVWEWVNEGLALTKMKIVDDAKNQNIVWDENGFLCREYSPILDNYEDKQLKIINKGLFLTDDNWKTSKAGIGNFIFYNPQTGQYEEDYGVIANTIVGNLILSEEVGIYNENNSVQIDKDGFVITTKNGNNTVFKIQKETSEDTFDNLLFVDSEGNLHIKGDITATRLELGDNVDLSDKIILDGYVTSEDLNGYVKNDDLSDYVKTGELIGSISEAISKYEQDNAGRYLLKEVYDKAGHVVFGITKGTDTDDKTYFALDANGLLKARNAVIYGEIYASAGSFVGTLKSGSTKDGYNFIADDGVIKLGRRDTAGNYNMVVNTDGSITFGSGVSLSWNNLPADVASNSDIPTNTSQLKNDNNLAYKSDIPTDYATESELNTVNNKITKTYIDSLGIEASTVKANWVYAGKIAASQINAGTIKSLSGAALNTEISLNSGLITMESILSKETFGFGVNKYDDLVLQYNYSIGDKTSVKLGYYYGGNFYKDSNHNDLIIPSVDYYYGDIPNGSFYKYSSGGYSIQTDLSDIQKTYKGFIIHPRGNTCGYTINQETGEVTSDINYNFSVLGQQLGIVSTTEDYRTPVFKFYDFEKENTSNRYTAIRKQSIITKYISADKISFKYENNGSSMYTDINFVINYIFEREDNIEEKINNLKTSVTTLQSKYNELLDEIGKECSHESTYTEIKRFEDSTCMENGYKEVATICALCGEELTIEGITIGAKEHIDQDNNGYCDTCGSQIGTFYTITANANDPTYGYVNGGGNYLSGKTVELNAVPYSGYEFNGWSDGYTSNPRYITVARNATYTANFKAISISEPTITEGVTKTVNVAKCANSGGSGALLTDFTFVKFIPTVTGTYQFEATGGTTGDTYGRLYDANKLNPLAVDDDSGTGNHFLFNYNCVAGTTYYLAVKYYNNTADDGTVDLLVTLKTSDGTSYSEDTIVDGVLYIGTNTTLVDSSKYRDNTTITKVIIPNNVTGFAGGDTNSGGGQCFRGCTGLSEVVIGTGVTTISYACFYGCSNLKTLRITSNTTTIKDFAFDSTSLKDVYYSGTQSQWNSISIGSNNSPLNNATKHYNS